MSEKINCIYEEFSSIEKLLSTLKSRPNNEIMRNENDSDSRDESFTHTKSYDEAVSLFRNGYTDILGDVKREVSKNNKILYTNPINRRQIKNMPVGFIPNVPNAIQNHPDSMINIISTPQKRKTLSIIYAMSGSAGESANTFVQAGAALVSAINLIELSGIQTRLYVNFMPAVGSESKSLFSHGPDKELLSPVLRIKNYGERFNLTKICFPLAHPSMFRRIGFKYLETCPFITAEGYASGYGHVPKLEQLREYIPTDNQTYILNTAFIKDHNYNIMDILKELEIVKNDRI